MEMRTKLLSLFLVLQLVNCSRAESTIQPRSVDRQGRDLHHYHYSAEDSRPEYPVLSSNYYREGYLECPTSPVTSFIGRGLNYLLLKVGVVAIVKAILAGLLLVKVPLLFLKMALLKTFFFPVLIAPLLLHFFTNQQSQEMRPQEDAPAPAETSSGMGRQAHLDRLSERVWRSMKTFAGSEQCAERVACVIGAYNKDSSGGVTFSRALKLFEQSSPSHLHKRLSSIREAFKSGVRNGSCPEQDFACHGPELYIQQGTDKMQLI